MIFSSTDTSSLRMNLASRDVNEVKQRNRSLIQMVIDGPCKTLDDNRSTQVKSVHDRDHYQGHCSLGSSHVQVMNTPSMNFSLALLKVVKHPQPKVVGGSGKC